MSQYNPKFIFGNTGIKIYKTSLLDSMPFHMHVTMDFDNKEAFDYKSPFMRCSNTEATAAIIPDVPSTEVWATMIIHEYFHGFQFKHPGYLDYFEEAATSMTQDTLKVLYSHNSWYKESVNRENDILLSAIASEDIEEIDSLVNSFFELRQQRRVLTQQKLNTDIAAIEQLFETMEGSARYVEFKLYDIFSTKQPGIIGMMKSDTMYQSYSYFKNFSFEESQWLYKSGSTYYYAIGFNILRLLDKLKVDYQTKLFQDSTSLEGILKTELHYVER